MSFGFGTRAVHAAQRPDPTTGAVIPPLSLSTTYKQSAAGVHTVSYLMINQWMN
jgi:cystathionine gamma-lyase